MNANGNVKIGEPFRPSASVWNSLVAMKRRASDAPVSVGARGTWNKGLTVLVKNDALSLDAGSPVGIGDIVITPDDDTAAEWRTKQVYNYVLPEDGKPWGVILSPAPSNALVPLYLSGTVPAKITMSDTTHEYARINASGELVSGPFGDARILWSEPNPEASESNPAETPWKAWCLLALGEGKKREEVPYGYIRLYRGNNSGTIEWGRWYWMATTAVIDTNGEYLGSEYSPTGTPGTNGICVPLTEMPDPYSGTVPEGIANNDRTDYVIASIGSMAPFHIGGSPYIVPNGTTGGEFTSMTVAELMELASKTDPTTEETFTLSNVWFMATSGHGFKINTPVGIGPSLEIDINGMIGLVGEPSAPITGNATAYCYLGNGSYGWVTIPTTGVTGGVEYTGTGSITISEDNIISLIGDVSDAIGFYFAGMDNGTPTRGFVDFDGSLCIDETAGTLQLEGDADAPSTGTDQLLYLYDRKPIDDADKKRKWAKLGTNGGLEVSDVVGSLGVRLKGTTDTAPSIGSVWGCIGTSSYGWISPCTLTINA